MAEFIWFFGASGAGKATIIEKVVKGNFSLPGIEGNLVVCRESIDWKREQRIKELEKELGKHAVLEAEVLIKGQSVDLSQLQLPQKISQTYPKLNQRFFFVYTEPVLLTKRVSVRCDGYWPNPNHDFQSETSYQINALDGLCQELDKKPEIINNSGSEPKIMHKAKLQDLVA